MLVLTRRVGEEIVIGENVRLTVVAVQGGRIRLGVAAPRSVRVHRQELRDGQFEIRVGPTLTAQESTTAESK